MGLCNHNYFKSFFKISTLNTVFPVGKIGKPTLITIPISNSNHSILTPPVSDHFILTPRSTPRPVPNSEPSSYILN